ncbi:HAAS signaling domain-containing protein [Methanobacterium oryzae]|uniref:HAAS signaling domain-containing protein n=1 Tax=Methanobacterium oryzae TaxID=69540 RepID=UPI003D1B6D1A
MNKDEYLEKLTELVKDMPEEDREDILSDYEEHFIIGLEKGRTEEEISRALGDPETVAKQIKVEQKIKKAEDKPSVGSIYEAALAATGLGFFNLVFIAGPALLLAAIIVGLFLTGLAIIFSGILATMSPVLHLLYPQQNLHLPSSSGFIGNLVIIGGGIGITIAGILLVVLMAYIAKWFYNLMIKYLKLNLKIIKGRNKS